MITLRWMINPRKLKDQVIENIGHRSSIIQLPGEENGAKEISTLYIHSALCYF